MHHATCTPAKSCCDASENTEPAAAPSVLSLILLPPRLLAASFWGAADVIRKTFDGAYSDCCSDLHGDCCGIPETPCPDRCVCRIHWHGCPGDSFQYQIQVTNTSQTKREFSLKSLPFPCTTDSVKVVPDKKLLGPDESLQAIATFTIPDSFAGSTYRTKIKVVGAYEQYIEVCLAVRPKQACCCHIEQGDIPKQIKAHHWFNHFQCEKDCFEPAHKVS
jgi:hypothetical protein